MGYTIINPGLTLGNVVATTAVVELNLDIRSLLERHRYGDFGEISDEDKSHNYSAMHHGFLVRSTYTVENPAGGWVEIYVETNAARTETFLCLVEEYNDM